MINNSFTDFVAYFRQLTQEHKQLKTFVHGPDDRIISGSRSDIDYPCLWLETPAIKPAENTTDNITGERSCAFVILQNAGDSTYAEEDEIWARTEQMALDVLSRMQRDKKKRLILFDLNSVTIDPVSPLFVANEIGWRVEFRLDKHLDLCYKPEKWEEE